MKATDIIDAIERFFLDLIGTIIPGAVLIIGISWIWPKQVEMAIHLPLTSSTQFRWIAFTVLSYLAGYALSSIGENIVVKAVSRLKKSRAGSKLLPDFILSDQELYVKIKGDPTFVALKKVVLSRIPSLINMDAEAISIPGWRSIAMSLAPEQRYTIYRFMFISLFNLGIATAFLLLTLFWWILAIVNSVKPNVTGHVSSAWYSCLLVVVSFTLLERRYYFHRRAMQVPFSMALMQLQNFSKNESLPKSFDEKGRHNQLTIYLAGGFQSGWQDRVKLAVPNVRYFDPRSHGLIGRAEYTAWDLQAIESSDCVFAYLEPSNPGGYALALEVGYARALNKFVIFIDEKSPLDSHCGRYLDMVAETSNVTLNTLEGGIEFLEQYITIV